MRAGQLPLPPEEDANLFMITTSCEVAVRAATKMTKAAMNWFAHRKANSDCPRMLFNASCVGSNEDAVTPLTSEIRYDGKVSMPGRFVPQMGCVGDCSLPHSTLNTC
jgi:hypothetical protein